jgi:GNAT superfamily N-acetyltransferase
MFENKIQIRPLSKEYLTDVKNISNVCFQDAYREEISVYESIVEVFPDGVWGAFYDNQLVGYIFFHPYKYPATKPLNSMLVLNGNENCMYLHEIAVLPEYRAHRIPTQLLHNFDKATQTHNIANQSLVSVQNSIGFWEKKGFSVVRKIIKGGYKDSYLMMKQV